MTSAHQTRILQQKLSQLQADNIIYQEEISRLRKRILSLQEYRIKYELLVEKQTEESPLHRSRRVDEINNMNKKIEENNDKWMLKVKLLEGRYEKIVHQLEDSNFHLVQELDSMKKGKSLGEKSTYGVDMSELTSLKQQVSSLRSRNAQLSQQLTSTKQKNTQLTSSIQSMHQKQSSLQTLQQQLQQRLQQARYEQKQFYRQTIIQLQQNITQTHDQVAYHKERASPQREKQIARLISEIKRIQSQHEIQYAKFNLLISHQTQQIKSLSQTLNLAKSQSFEHVQSLQKQLEGLRERVLTSQQQHHAELMACRLQMEQLRSTQIQLLKKSFEKIQNTHDAQRIQWKLILKDEQDELQRIRKMWQEEKDKFSQEKNKLKSKINELKAREKRSAEGEKSRTQNQTYKLISSLKQIDEQENKYNDYESNVTFFSRQLKRATTKIEQKQRECAKLINELRVQREEFETEAEFIKKVQRQQVHYYKQKLIQTDEQNTKLLQELRQKDKYMRDKDVENRVQHQKIRKENQQLNDIIHEMQRDYSRLTDNKKNLFQSYRSERDMVFTGRVQLNQERKNKLLHLDRQKNELEIAYKERDKQIKIEYELKINQLTEKLSKINQQKELASAENDILKERVKESGDKFGKAQNQQNVKDFHRKLATLDLEISLTQNLFSTIKSVRNRNNRQPTRSQLDEMSEHESIESATSKEHKIINLQNDSIDAEQYGRDNVAPTFSRGKQEQQKRQEEYQNFSFKPQVPMIKVMKVKKNNPSEMSFNHHEANDGDKSPGWGDF